MDGRWTIVVDAGDVPELGGLAVPVVPCDFAAEERVTAALFPHVHHGLTDDEADRFARELARIALRAAAKAP